MRVAAWIWSSSFHRTGDVKLERGRMGSGASGVGSGWCRRESENVLTSRTVGDSETEASEEQGPSGLPGVETFCFLEILQILVVGDHYKGVLSAL